MKVKITKIKLQLKDREIELSAEEARQVLAELQELFSSEAPSALKDIAKQVKESSALEDIAKQVKELTEREPKREFVPYPNPIIIERSPTTWPPYWGIGDVYCGATSADASSVCLTIGDSVVPQ